MRLSIALEAPQEGFRDICQANAFASQRDLLVHAQVGDQVFVSHDVEARRSRTPQIPRHPIRLLVSECLKDALARRCAC